MENSGDSYGADAIAQWRKFVLDRVLAFSLLMVTAAVLLGLREDYRFGHPVLAYALIPSWLLVAVATLWPRASTRFRQVALIVGIATAAVGSASLSGFLMPNPFSAHLMLVLVVTLFLGQRAAWWGLARGAAAVDSDCDRIRGWSGTRLPTQLRSVDTVQLGSSARDLRRYFGRDLERGRLPDQSDGERCQAERRARRRAH